MADSFSLAIKTPIGTIIFTGDFKFDHTPVDGEHFDLSRLAHHGDEGVLCLFSDSTNSETLIGIKKYSLILQIWIF